MQSLHDLSEVPFISLGAGTGTRDLYSQYFLSHHLVFSPDMEASTTDQILPMVAHNLGIGFYPEALASEPIARGEVLPIRLVEPIPEREICLIRDTGRPESIAARKLMNICRGIPETASLKCFFLEQSVRQTYLQLQSSRSCLPVKMQVVLLCGCRSMPGLPAHRQQNQRNVVFPPKHVHSRSKSSSPVNHRISLSDIFSTSHTSIP